MPADLSIETQLQHCRQKLIAAFSPDLADANCYVVATPIALKTMGRIHVQLWDDGGNYSGIDGGARCEWTMGVAVFSVLVVDQQDKYVAASKELRNFVRRIRNAVQLFYDATFAEPPQIRSHSAARPTAMHQSRGVFSIELRFRMLSVQTYDELQSNV